MGDSESRRLGESATPTRLGESGSGRLGEWETRRVGDSESGRHGEWETRRAGDSESGRLERGRLGVWETRRVGAEPRRRRAAAGAGPRPTCRPLRPCSAPSRVRTLIVGGAAAQGSLLLRLRAPCCSVDPVAAFAPLQGIRSRGGAAALSSPRRPTRMGQPLRSRSPEPNGHCRRAVVWRGCHWVTRRRERLIKLNSDRERWRLAKRDSGSD